MKNVSLLLTLIFTLCSAQTFADEYLIKEMESLRSTLDKNDPDYFELGLRLADLYFDISIQESDRKDVLASRKKALSLYEEAINLSKKMEMSPLKRHTIDFQIARVLKKLGNRDEAKSYYEKVQAADKLPIKIRREATLSLAEYYEEDAKFEKADSNYLMALDMCKTVQSCNYVHYRRAWLYYRELKLDTAISELKLSLFESNGSVREKVINDLMLFFSNQNTNGEAELKYISFLEEKTKRNDLARKLVEAFYGAGNRLAGSTVLVHLNEKKPDPFYEMRLLEEFYGFRDITEVKKYLGQIEKRKQSEIPKTPEEAKEFKAMLKRVIVQFDSEAEADDRYFDILKRSIITYLTFYPQDEMRNKMQQGWLKAEVDKSQKLTQLGVWIQEEIKFKTENEHIRKLRQTRISLAQELKKYDIVLAEALAINKILSKSGKSNEAREFAYVAAYEYYRAKDFKNALPLFIPLTELEENTLIDKYALQAQNLVLDIYNQEQRYAEIVKQSDKWLRNTAFLNNKLYKNDIKEMGLIRSQAEFESTAALGENKDALQKFYDLCFAGTFAEKSCANAKVLAIKLKDQSKLVSLLEKEGDEKSLMNEYELMGRFADAAKLIEKYELNSQAGMTTYFRVALLFELDADLKNRDRVLNKLISYIKKTKKIDPKYEGLLFTTLAEANLIDTQTMLLPWSVDRKIEIANRLADKSKTAKKFLMSSAEYTGPTWAKNVLKKAKALYDKQAKTAFYGRYSKTLFKRRIARLDKFKKYITKYLEGSDIRTRIYLINMAYNAYQNLAIEIMSTPIPEGVTEDVLLQVQASLKEMSTPYGKVANDYQKLLNEQMNQVPLTEKDGIYEVIDDPEMNYIASIKDFEFKQELTSNFDFTAYIETKSKLNEYPSDQLTIAKLENELKNAGQARLAAYFTGRKTLTKQEI